MSLATTLVVRPCRGRLNGAATGRAVPVPGHSAADAARKAARRTRFIALGGQWQSLDQTQAWPASGAPSPEPEPKPKPKRR